MNPMCWCSYSRVDAAKLLANKQPEALRAVEEQGGAVGRENIHQVARNEGFYTAIVSERSNVEAETKRTLD